MQIGDISCHWQLSNGGDGSDCNDDDDGGKLVICRWWTQTNSLAQCMCKF